MSTVVSAPSTTSSISSTPRKKYRAPQRPTIQELKDKYESQPSNSPKKTPKPKSPKMFNKSKVKQMASLFNNKISQIIRRDGDANKYTNLVNELSPEPKMPTVEFTGLPSQPIALPRTLFAKAKLPVPSPRRTLKAKKVEKPNCFVAEELFPTLTVKDKALLYNQFIDDMSRKNPQRDEMLGEVITEKQESVKSLLEELENRCKSSCKTSTPVALQRKSSVRKLENMFYNWLKERQDHEVTNHEASNTSEMDEENQKSAIERLLEEAIAKLESMENSHKEESVANLNAVNGKSENEPKSLNSTKGSGKIRSHKKKPAPAVPCQSSTKPSTSSETSTTPSTESSCTPSTASSAKHSEAEESESGLCSLTKTTSEESQPESQPETPQEIKETSEKPPTDSKPLRKKKMRRSLSWRKDTSLVETYTVSTTDSEGDSKDAKASKPLKPVQSLTTEEPPSKQFDASFAELDQSLMRVVNSPRKIKSVYTLTAPSPARFNEAKDSPCSSDNQQDKDVSFVSKHKSTKVTAEPRSLTDSFDQGFETGSTELDSPIRKRPQKLPLKRQIILNKSASSPRVSIEPKFRLDKPSCFSTPIKDQLSQSLNSYNRGPGAQQQLFSPISATPFKNRRRSIYDNESRRSSLAMQVIREDQPLETHDIQSAYTNNNTNAFFANAPTLDMSSNITALKSKAASYFWIKSGDFSVSLDIFPNDPERVKLLYEIFSQTSCETKDLHFGIDGHKFSVHNVEDMPNISKRMPQSKETSHYWFSTGDLAIPFSGKVLTADKIQRLFQFIKASVEETGILRFGIDAVEFSNVPEFWTESPKFSLESNYSMLVGLQSGNSNGLEGRSKYAWPHTKRTPVSDLDDTDYNDCDQFEENESCRLSFSPFGSNYFDLASLGAEELMMPRNSEAMKSHETFYEDFENEPLDQLFDTAKSSQTDESLAAAVTEVPKMLNIMEEQQQRLSSVHKQLATYSKAVAPALSSGALEALKGSPEYLTQLKGIVSDISQMGCSGDGFTKCSVEQLERYMLVLTSYADICLNSCGSHLDTVLEALRDHRAVPPENELQKSHDHNPAALSEHQLRIQASLQRLNIPDWFRQYNQNQKSPEGAGSAGGAAAYKPGNFTRKRTQDSGRWVGLNSKTTSLSSLGSQRSDRSPLLLSPSAHSHHGGQTTAAGGHHGGGHHHGVGGVAGTTGASGAAFSRWSTSHLNSSQTSPSVSQRGSFTRGGPINSSFISVNSGNSVLRNSMRQPYLGWRSQEKLSQRTAHERLASSLLAQQQRTSPTTQMASSGGSAANRKLQPVTPEIQSSIKEVTSAIVHYVNDQTNQQRSRSTSPNSRKCWLESSFVGIRPLDSPQTPVIENTPLIAAVAAANANLRPLLSGSNINNNNNSFQIANHNFGQIVGSGVGGGGVTANASAVTAAFLNSSAPLTGNDLQQLTRMNGGLNNGSTSSSSGGGGIIHYPVAAERSLSNASLEDVLASLLGLPTHPPQPQILTGAIAGSSSALASDAFARSSTGGVTVSGDPKLYMPQKPQQLTQQHQTEQQQQQLLGISKEEQQRLRRRSEGDAPTKQKQQQQQHQQLQQQQQQPQQLSHQQQQQLQLEQKFQHQTPSNAKAYASDTIAAIANAHTHAQGGPANGHAGGGGVGLGSFLPPRRVSLGDSSESNNRTTSASGELQIKCRNNKCDRTATPIDAKKYYKSCHNCTYLYCSRECRRAHWEKHRKACLHSRVSNLCRQVLASCKDDSDSLRHLSLLARKGFLSQGRGVVRILFRSPESAEGFIKNGFQCMGEASYVRWPDLMPAEMGLELYSELLKLSTEYRPDSKMLVYVAVCVVSEAPGMGQAPVRWERQLVSRCAKLKLCKSVLAELDQQPIALQQPITMVAVPEPTTEVLILTFNPQLRSSTTQREMVLSNILDILSRRGVILRKHYPEIFQRFQSYTEGQTDKINPVTLHPRDSHTGQNFVCIIMPVQSDTEIIKLPSMADGGNRVTTIDVGSASAVTQLEDDELLTRTSNSAIAS